MAAGERALLAHDPEVAQRLAMRLLACDPTDEAAARLAMRASHRSGDPDAVRQTFAQVRDALFHDLAAQPADETVALHRELMLAEMPPRTTTATSTTPAANDEPASGEGASAFVDPPTVLPLPTTRPMPAMVTPPLSRRALLIGASCMVAVVAVVGSALA